jgi:glycosyltransferase involved in cell wall biosynthesis
VRIAHLIPYLGRAQGGPVFGLAACAKALADSGCDVEILTVRRPADGELVALPPNVRITAFDDSGRGSFRRCPALGPALLQAGGDLIHSHGLWTDVHRLAAVLARQRGLPHLLAPCGMLAPGALRHHWWKKVPVRLWFQDRALRDAQCLQAKSRHEYEHIRQYGLRNPVAVIANPISLPCLATGVSRADCRRFLQIPDKRKVVLFLGRLHPVKGLPRLLRAWGRVQSEKAESGKQELARKARDRGQKSDDWVLVLAGPDEGGQRKELEALVAELSCQDSVVFTGALHDDQKWAALAAADLFVMPSDFENFGNAIVEAMLSGLPVITTTGTPWKELPAAGAGWWIEPTVEALALALREALAMPEEKRCEMGRQALSYSARFRPETAAADLVAVYHWLLGRAERPGCVVL